MGTCWATVQFINSFVSSPPLAVSINEVNEWRLRLKFFQYCHSWWTTHNMNKLIFRRQCTFHVVNKFAIKPKKRSQFQGLITTERYFTDYQTSLFQSEIAKSNSFNIKQEMRLCDIPPVAWLKDYFKHSIHSWIYLANLFTFCENLQMV